MWWSCVAVNSTGSTCAVPFPLCSDRRLTPLQVLDSKHRPCLTERELLNNLKAIIADADKTPRNQVAQGAVGTLTTENRKVWANLRTTLGKQRGNKACLDIIDAALFVVCLDDSAPESASEMCSNMLSGTYKLDRGASDLAVCGMSG